MAKKKYNYRDAETGEFVTEEYAKENPKTTVRELVNENTEENEES